MTKNIFRKHCYNYFINKNDYITEKDFIKQVYDKGLESDSTVDKYKVRKSTQTSDSVYTEQDTMSRTNGKDRRPGPYVLPAIVTWKSLLELYRTDIKFHEILERNGLLVRTVETLEQLYLLCPSELNQMVKGEKYERELLGIYAKARQEMQNFVITKNIQSQLSEKWSYQVYESMVELYKKFYVNNNKFFINLTTNFLREILKLLDKRVVPLNIVSQVEISNILQNKEKKEKVLEVDLVMVENEMENEMEDKLTKHLENFVCSLTTDQKMEFVLNSTYFKEKYPQAQEVIEMISKNNNNDTNQSTTSYWWFW